MDTKQLTRLARESQSTEVQLKAVEHLHDDKILSALIQNTEKPVAQAAIEKISRKDTLQKLMKTVRKKSIRQLVCLRYDELFGEEEKHMERQREVETVLAALEETGKAHDWSQVSEEYSLQLDRWNQVSGYATDSHQRTFHDLVENCQFRKTEYDLMAAERSAKAAEIGARVQTRDHLLQELAAASEVLQEHPAELIADTTGRWNSLGAPTTPEELTFQERFDRAITSFSDSQNRLQDRHRKKEATQEALQTILSELTALKEGEMTPNLRSTLAQHTKNLHGLDQTFKTDLPDLFEACQSMMTELEGKVAEWEASIEEQSQELRKEYETLIATVEAMKTTSRSHTQQVRKIQTKWGSMMPLEAKEQEALNTRFRQSCDRYFDTLKESMAEREWSEFANLAAKERLIAETEALDKIEDPVELAKKIKEKQIEWKKLGPVPYAKSDEIWLRFKTTSDTLYQRCRAYYEEQDAKRQQSLETKLALCAEAESVQHSQDWKVVGDRLKELQQQWNDAGQAPRKDDQLAWDRFRTACDTFFAARKSHYEKLDAERAENTRRKQALVDELENVVVSEKVREAAQRIKELQAEWKTIGPATRDLEHPLWERFHKTADEFFAKRKEQYQKIQASLEEHAVVKEALCTRLKAHLGALDENSDWTALSQEFRQSQKDWRTLPGAGIERDQELWVTFKGLCDDFFKARDEFYDKLSDEDRVKLNIKEEYCLKVELLAESSEWRETAGELKKLQAEFHELPSVNEKYDRLMYKRFHTICQTFFDRRREHFKEQDDQRQDNYVRKKALCVRLEELAGVKFQEEEPLEKISMADLASRLQEALAPNLAEAPAEPLSFKDASEEVRELQAAWKTIGPVPNTQSQAIWERFRHAAETFYEKRNAFFAERQIEEEQTLKAKEALLAKLEAQLEEPDFKTVKNLQQQWRDCGQVLRGKGRELQQKFQALCDQIYQAASEGTEHPQGEVRM